MPNPKSPLPEKQEARLDPTTELCIGALRDAATDYQHARDHGKEMRWSDVTYAEKVLRSRIRTLIEEARQNAVTDFLADKNFSIESRSGHPNER